MAGVREKALRMRVDTLVQLWCVMRVLRTLDPRRAVCTLLGDGQDHVDRDVVDLAVQNNLALHLERIALLANQNFRQKPILSAEYPHLSQPPARGGRCRPLRSSLGR